MNTLGAPVFLRWVRGSSDPLPPKAAYSNVAGLRPAALLSALRRSAAPPAGGSEDPRTQSTAVGMASFPAAVGDPGSQHA